MIGDRQWIETSLARLVSTSSLSGREGKAQGLARDLMIEAGTDDVRIVPVGAAVLRERYDFRTPTPTEGMFAVVGAWGLPSNSPFVVLNGHVDTAPAAPGWSVDPLEPTVTNGWMNGLGSADMKAGVIGAIAGSPARAARSLRAYVEVQTVPDEEDGGGTGTLACVHELLTRKRIPDFAVVCEPTRVQIATSQIGSRAVEYSIRGVQAHANMKHRGVSAVEAAIELARDLEGWAHASRRSEHPLLSPASVNIGRIEGGVGATSVAPSCRMEVCFTYHPDDEALLLSETEEITDGVRGKIRSSSWKSASSTTLSRSRPIPRSPRSWRWPGPWGRIESVPAGFLPVRTVD
jgi:acetylornithine deacetylase